MFTIDFEIIKKKHLQTFYFYYLKTSQKLFRSIITIQKHEGGINISCIKYTI